MIGLFLIFIGILLVVIFILYLVIRYYINTADELLDTMEKAFEFYHILIRWLQLKQEGKTMIEYFKQNKYQTVAVYGMKEIGVLLYNELRQEGIDIRYAIDKNADEIEADIEIIKPTSEMPEVDVIVVTATHYFDNIYMQLQELTETEIVSISDILWTI